MTTLKRSPISQSHPATFSRKSIVTAISNAITIGLLEILMWIAFLALIFTGPLSSYLGRAATFMIAGVIITGAIAGFRSSWQGVIQLPQDIPAAILAIVGARIVAASADLPPDTVFVTVFATIGVATVVMGLFFYLLGTFQLGNLVRFLPFPVIAGFLGGTGWILVSSSVTSSLPPQFNGNLLDPNIIGFWLPAIVLGLVLYFGSLRIASPLLLPLAVVGVSAAFLVVANALGYSMAELTNAGWYLGDLPRGGQMRWFSSAEIQSIQWPLILRESGSILVLAGASAIGMLLNTSGFELSVKDNLNPNTDLRATGLGNILAGLIGGWPCYMSPSLSQINAKDGRQYPLTAPLVGIVGAILFWNATTLLAFLPRFVAGSVVAYIGFGFLFEWVVLPARRLARLEYVMLLSVLLVIVFVGLLEGVGVGLVMAIILFVINYAQINVLRHHLTGTHQQSRVTRPAEHRVYLRSVSEQTHMLQLQGYVFFGTANSLVDKVYEITDASPLKFFGTRF